MKPKVKKRAPQAVESQSEVKILFHIQRGSDVPIRLKYYNDALVINDKINKTKNSRGVAENLDSKLNKKVDEL